MRTGRPFEGACGFGGQTSIIVDSQSEACAHANVRANRCPRPQTHTPQSGLIETSSVWTSRLSTILKSAASRCTLVAHGRPPERKATVMNASWQRQKRPPSGRWGDGRPPVHQVMHRLEIAVNGVPSPISLAVVPGVADPLEVSFEGVFRVGNCVWSQAFFARWGGELIYPFLLFLDGWQRVACFCRRAHCIDFE
jgi:hypothetical protein